MKRSRFSLSPIKRLLRTIDGRLPLCFAVSYLIVGSVLAAFVPLFHGLDEAAHFNRAYQVSEGGIKSYVNHEGRLGGTVPDELRSIQRSVTNYLKGDPVESYFVFLKKVYTVEMKGEEAFVSYPGAAAYSPIAYLPASLTLAVTKGFEWPVGIYMLLTRLSMLVSFIGIVYLALRLVNRYRVKWLIVAFLSIPVVIFQSSVLSADTLPVALAVLLFCLLYVGLQRSTASQRFFSLAVTVSTLLSLIKFTYFPVALLVLMLPLHKQKVRNFSISSMMMKILAAAVITIPTLIWNITVMSYADMNNSNRYSLDSAYNASVSGQVKYSLENPLNTALLIPKTVHEHNKFESVDFYSTMTSRVGYNSMRMPTFTTAFITVVFILTALYCAREMRKRISLRNSWIIFSASALSAMAIFGVLYLSHTNIGAEEVAGMQGRYFLPLMLFIVPALVHCLNMTLSTAKIRIVCLVLFSMVISIFSLLMYYIHSTYYSI